MARTSIFRRLEALQQPTVHEPEVVAALDSIQTRIAANKPPTRIDVDLPSGITQQLGAIAAQLQPLGPLTAQLQPLVAIATQLQPLATIGAFFYRAGKILDSPALGRFNRPDKLSQRAHVVLEFTHQLRNPFIDTTPANAVEQLKKLTQANDRSKQPPRNYAACLEVLQAEADPSLLGALNQLTEYDSLEGKSGIELRQLLDSRLIDLMALEWRVAVQVADPAPAQKTHTVT